MNNIFEKTDFKSGIVTYKSNTLQEDILQVKYPHNFTLDMGWYSDKFIIYVIKDYMWDEPIAEYVTKNTEELSDVLSKAVNVIEQAYKR